MAASNIKAKIPSNLHKVWNLVLDVKNYSAWRSDLSKTAGSVCSRYDQKISLKFLTISVGKLACIKYIDRQAAII